MHVWFDGFRICADSPRERLREGDYDEPLDLFVTLANICTVVLIAGVCSASSLKSRMSGALPISSRRFSRGRATASGHGKRYGWG